MKMSMVSVAVILPWLLWGCGQERSEQSPSMYQTPDQALFEQQVAAYPELDESAYLTLTDFEAADQLDDFYLAKRAKASDQSRIFYSGSPTGTGEGALGVSLDSLGDYTLALDLPIRRWSDFNLLMFAMYVDQPVGQFAVEVVDHAGRSAQKRYILESGWNKLKFDLRTLTGQVDWTEVERVCFHFMQVGGMRAYLDDVILVDYHKTLAGDPDGSAGLLFAVQDGKRIRLGAAQRFEVVFEEGNWIGWYDLETDENRMNNLLPTKNAGVNISMPNGGEHRQVNVHTSVSVRSGREIQLEVETFYGAMIADRPTDQVVRYRVRPDGVILITITAKGGGGKFDIQFGVAGDQGFDGLVGTVDELEYAFFRRMGKKAGADLLVALKPWKGSKKVECEIKASEETLQAIFTGDAREGENRIGGMLKLWPATIDRPENAETIVRNYLGT